MPSPFREQLLAYLLTRASHVVGRDLQEALKQRGVTMREWRILGTLWDEDDLTVNQLAAIIMCEQSTTTRVVGRLASSGLIGKRTRAEDRRKVHVFLTDKGRAMVDELVVLATDAEQEFADAHGCDDTEALRAELRALIKRHARPGETENRK